jgi:DNA-binding response OmpR family regulator
MPPTILIVDDDPHIRSTLSCVLTRAGYDVEQAVDGMAALDQIATHAPDLILTDVQMPRLDGIGLASRLTGQTAAIPVILMSGERVPSEDLVPFIFKPFALQTVLELINFLLPDASGGDASGRKARIAPAPETRERSVTESLLAGELTVLRSRGGDAVLTAIADRRK